MSVIILVTNVCEYNTHLITSQVFPVTKIKVKFKSHKNLMINQLSHFIQISYSELYLDMIVSDAQLCN